MTTNLSLDDKFYSISESIKIIRENISEASVKSGRNYDDIKLMAVTKTVDPLYINYSIDNCGIDLIGENKVQEFLSKKEQLHLDGVNKHIIGHLQTNKVNKIINEVDMIQSVDSVHLAEEISKRSLSLNKTTHILLEINIGGELSKTGFDKNEIFENLDAISHLPNLEINGIMTIPPVCEDSNALNGYFNTMSLYYDDIKSKGLRNFNMSILSMGMSGDYIPAIENGSNMVRIGSLIYGARIYK